MLNQLFKAQQIDKHIITIKTLLRDAPHENFIIKNYILYKTINGVDLFIVPETMQAEILKAAHERSQFPL